MSAQWELKNCSALTHPTPSSWVVILFLPGMKNCQSVKAPGSRLLPFPVISSVSDIRLYRFSLTFPRQPDYWSSGSPTHCTLGSFRCHFHTEQRLQCDWGAQSHGLFTSFQSIEWKRTCLACFCSLLCSVWNGPPHSSFFSYPPAPSLVSTISI